MVSRNSKISLFFLKISMFFASLKGWVVLCFLINVSFYHGFDKYLTIVNINSQRTNYHVSLGIRFGVPFG
ncbi:hypothetical protein AR158_c674L [Paramecium bursaria Chlorella virus AR158]|uniref:hypothetical protein n=1 Tax=Paramecium bursaria Chlorella virus AR158 TaxID=380598 RepID=UPI00015AA835|nr:hypothetical protein AR158_c674L [Paramecium bursaria Chlorella virus AR158]ABU44219.1 hypothetical protein AR158_c674L [Paramecium bursaria Chlorella virus AR158]